MTTDSAKPFQPKVKPKKAYRSKASTIIAIIGAPRKAAFVEYCAKYDLGQTEMLKQMIDYCINSDPGIMIKPNYDR